MVWELCYHRSPQLSMRVCSVHGQNGRGAILERPRDFLRELSKKCGGACHSRCLPCHLPFPARRYSANLGLRMHAGVAEKKCAQLLADRLDREAGFGSPPGAPAKLMARLRII